MNGHSDAEDELKAAYAQIATSHAEIATDACYLGELRAQLAATEDLIQARHAGPR